MVRVGGGGGRPGLPKGSGRAPRQQIPRHMRRHVQRAPIQCTRAAAGTTGTHLPHQSQSGGGGGGGGGHPVAVRAGGAEETLARRRGLPDTTPWGDHSLDPVLPRGPAESAPNQTW